MTSEIVVANKVGISLAADSTVTIRSSAGDKTYNTANKLFAISKLHPVGALVYGSTTINGIPIEVIIKEFRQQLPDKEKDTLQEYADEFMNFLQTRVPITDTDNADNFAAIVSEYCRRLQMDIRRAILDRRIILGDVSSVRAAMREFINDFRARVNTSGHSPSVIGLNRNNLSAQYPNVVENEVNRLFGLFNLTTATRNRIVDLIYDACLSNELTDNRLGIVIAGYGRKEYYPSIVSYETDGMFAKMLKIVPYAAASVTNDSESFVYPFAQRDVSALFMEGVDPIYQEYADRQLRDLMSGLADVAGKFFGATDRRKIARFRRALMNLANEVIGDFEQRREQWFISRTIDAVEFLDKSELAALAESLVSLTALRQKISLDIETVGGPIDVAVISKGDGFIWIKRKYYFQGDLNPFYFQRYIP